MRESTWLHPRDILDAIKIYAQSIIKDASAPHTTGTEY